LARTVLLADDSVTAQNMGRRILIDAGYEVITVNNGSAALKKIHESRPDLIVLDVYMPGYGGLEVCQRLKESSETSRIPVLLTVGKMEPFKPEEARRVRAEGHIIKPFDASELLAALTKLEDRIVPPAEPPRGRKSKSEKKSKSWQVADPAVSYDDAHSDKISYLTEVKQKQSERHQHDETVESPVEAPLASAQEELPAPVEKPRMAMPMSVYAAEQLRELPVVAEPAPAVEEFTPQKEQEQSQSSLAEAQEESSVAAPVSDEKEQPATVEEVTAAAPEFEGTFEQSGQVAQTESTPATVAETAPAEQEIRVTDTDKAMQVEDAPAQAQGAPSSSRWIAENVAVSAEEAALELEREMHQAQAVAQSPVEAHSESADGSASATADATAPSEPEEAGGATFAAAAGASASSTSAVSSQEGESEATVPSETAAAWENWQHIRDSVMGSQTAVSLSQSVVEAVQASVSAPVAEFTEASIPVEENKVSETPADAQPAEATSSEDESAALSSIVDSVLAELKPKLMAEISKKLKK
jgi:CheY-like chemotaxis protein